RRAAAPADGKPRAAFWGPGPRPVKEPILNRASYVWVAIVGVVHAAVTLGVIAIAQHEYGTATARMMGLVTFSLMNVLYSFTVRYETRSVFSLETFADRTFLLATGI